MFHDPFFGSVHGQMRRQMQQMDELMGGMLGGQPGGLMSPAMPLMPGFPRMMTPPLLGVPQNPLLPAVQPHPLGAMGVPQMPFGGGLMGQNMLSGMLQQMGQMQNRALNAPNAQVFTQSTVVGMGFPNGAPQVVETTSSVRQTGDVKEVRNSVRDSGRGEQTMSIGHHIGDRAHIIRKTRDRAGNLRQQQRFHNLDREKAKEFDSEFVQKVGGQTSRGGRPPHAIEAPRRRTAGESGPIIEEITDDASDDGDAKRRRPSTSHAGPSQASQAFAASNAGPFIEEAD